MYLVSFLRGALFSKRKERKAMHLKLDNLEAVALMNALQNYLKDLEKSGGEKGVQIEKKTVKGLINRIESMPAGEVP
jgi:hypothetical protein